jgi:hypothetical protein
MDRQTYALLIPKVVIANESVQVKIVAEPSKLNGKPETIFVMREIAPGTMRHNQALTTATNRQTLIDLLS